MGEGETGKVGGLDFAAEEPVAAHAKRAVGIEEAGLLCGGGGLGVSPAVGAEVGGGRQRMPDDVGECGHQGISDGLGGLLELGGGPIGGGVEDPGFGGGSLGLGGLAGDPGEGAAGEEGGVEGRAEGGWEGGHDGPAGLCGGGGEGEVRLEEGAGLSVGDGDDDAGGMEGFGDAGVFAERGDGPAGGGGGQGGRAEAEPHVEWGGEVAADGGHAWGADVAGLLGGAGGEG